MKIYDWNSPGAAAAGAARALDPQSGDRAAGTRGKSATGSGDDRVELSNTLARLSRALSAEGAARAGRIQALAARYENGTYRVDATATSARIITEALAADAQVIGVTSGQSDPSGAGANL